MRNKANKNSKLARDAPSACFVSQPRLTNVTHVGGGFSGTVVMVTFFLSQSLYSNHPHLNVARLCLRCCVISNSDHRQSRECAEQKGCPLLLFPKDTISFLVACPTTCKRLTCWFDPCVGCFERLTERASLTTHFAVRIRMQREFMRVWLQRKLGTSVCFRAKQLLGLLCVTTVLCKGHVARGSL
jgi:hypothetical protein